MTTAIARPGLHKPDEDDERRLLFRDRIFATQEYIPWVIGALKLGDKPDFSRVRNDQVKVLEGHSGLLSIGMVKRAWHDRQNSVFRSDFEIPKIAANADARERIENNLMRDISVGAVLVWSSLTLDNEDTIEEWESIDDALWTAHEWVFVEQSLTPIPKDPRAGLDRDYYDDVLREDQELVLIGLDTNGKYSAIMHRTGEEKHSLRLTEIIDGRRRSMTTLNSISEEEIEARVEARATALQAQREADARRLAESKAHENQIANLRQETDGLRGTIASLEASIKESDEARALFQQNSDETRELIVGLEQSLKEEREARDNESKINAEYRAKLDTLQFRPEGAVLQLGNWTPGERTIDLGNVVKLTWDASKASDAPIIDPKRVTLEESFLEKRQSDLEALPARHPVASNVCAQIPFSAIAERERQLELIRTSNMASGIGVRQRQVTVLPGDGGLVMARYAPILAGMNIITGVVGEQRLGYFSANPAAATNPANPIAEGAALTAGTWTMAGNTKQPQSLQMPFQMTTSLKAIDDGTFERLVNQSIFELLYNVLTAQVLAGNGTAPNLQGIWSQGSLPNINYGAGAADFDRQDILDLLNSVRLANTVGGGTIAVLSKGLWELAEKTPRGVDGTSSAGYTEIQRYLLDNIQYSDAGVMGTMEGAPTFYYSDLGPTGITNPGLALKADRCVVWIWGDSINMEYVPTTAASLFYRTVIEANCDFEHPTKNMARIRQT